MDAAMIDDCRKELRALRNKMIAFPEENWARERNRVAELERLLTSERKNEQQRAHA